MKKWIFIPAIIAVAFAVWATPKARNIREWVATFTYILHLVRKNYVQEVEPTELMQPAIQGMLQKLDPHSVYLDTIFYENLRIHTRGEYGGLGFRVGKIKNILTITDPFEGTPAYRAGIQPGDKIIKIGGIPTKGMKLHQAVSKMRGTPGTHVTLTVKREGIKEPIVFHLIREKIELKNVMYYGIVDDVGYIRLSSFSANAGKEVSDALDSLIAQGAQKFVLDLRSNPGGLLKQAAEVADNFLPKGKLIVSTKGRTRETNRDFYTTTPSKTPKAPLIVLVTRASASASEIVAGAIQDWDIGLVLGDTTFGKGSVQTVIPLEEGALKLTTAMYYTPSGRCINRPDTLYYLLRNPTLSKKFFTQGPLKRELASCGSIIPDIVLKPVQSLSSLLFKKSASPSDFLLKAKGEGVFMQYTSKYAREHPKLRPEFKVEPTMLEAFKSFMQAKEIKFEDQEFDSAAPIIKRTLKEMVAEAKWDTRGKYGVILEQDEWIQTSLDFLSKAHTQEDLFKLAKQ